MSNHPGKAPIAIPGILRLAYEFIFFGFATWALFETNDLTMGWIFLTIILIHYLISYDRILLLLKYTKFGNEKQ
ncbi:MAG: YrdB family protein [Anaerolineaceae bacterium]|nr:YrdB family protein [Anaerolineaceae bacterium]